MRRTRRLPFALLLALAACSEDAGVPAELRLDSGDATLLVRTRPLALTLSRAGRTLVQTATPAFEIGTSTIDKKSYFADPLAPDSSVSYLHLTDVTAAARDDGGWRLTVATSDPARAATLTLHPEPDGSFSFALTAAPDNDIVHTRVHLAANPDEHWFGLGEYFDTPDHRGQRRYVAFALDTTIESGYNEAHVPVPEIVSTRGWGLLLDDRTPLGADFASADSAVHLTLVDRAMHGHLVAAATPVATLARLQRHAGLPPLWPAWMFAPMQWRNDDPVTCSVPCAEGCNATRTGADIVLDDARAMRQLGLPASTIWIDAPWMTAFNDFQFNPIQFPNAQSLIDELHNLGYQVAVWAAPFINESDDRKVQCGMVAPPAGGLFTEAAQKGYFVKAANGQPIIVPWRGSTGAMLDFTNPDAFAFWKSLVHRATDMGVAGFKLDWDEYVVAALGGTRPDYRFFDGSTAATQHAVYHELFHRAHQEALQETHQEPGFIIARSGDATDSRYATAVWPGDLDNDFSTHRAPAAGGDLPHVGGLPAAVSGAVSLAASLHPHYGSDIGGFRHGLPKKETLARWIEFGALSTIMQLGGGGESHNPWDFTLSDFDQELLDIYRRYARLHMDLHPYLYAYVSRNSSDGTPILRAPALQYPADAALAAARDQYFFGDDLLVAPVVTPQSINRQVTFPAGRWFDFWSDAIIEGPTTIDVSAPLDRLPLFVRHGAIVPLLADDVDTLAPATAPGVITAELRADRMRVHVYGAANTNAFTLADKTRFETTASGAGLTFSVAGAPRERRYDAVIHWAALPLTPKTITRDNGATISLLSSLSDLEKAQEGAYWDANRRLLHIRFVARDERLTLQAAP